MKHALFLLITIIGTVLQVDAQKKYPKHEFRAAWISTVYNLDWPSKSGLAPSLQRQEFEAILDLYKSMNLNAVVVQVRPCADAFYPSPFEPWSQWLAGKQGEQPTPYYDPLAFMITEAHKRGMEFHAWFNPYRVFLNNKKNNFAPEHIAKQHPEWFLDYGSQRYFDPALPQTRNFLCKVIGDVVSRYDIDAVHFDDYFYPYKISGVDFPDTASFREYPRGFTAGSKADWRRDNVNLVIKALSDTIKALKPYVKFGISPFGIWRNASSDSRGSATAGGQNYDDLYADILLWLEKGWIDYVVPQIYWHRGKSNADYTVLARWWSENCFGRHLYIGHGIYRLDEKSDTKEWQTTDEIVGQIQQNRENDNILGSVFFRTSTFKSNPMNVVRILKKRFYKYPALSPPMPYLIESKPPTPIDVFSFEDKKGYKIVWDSPVDTSGINNAQFFVVYKNKDKLDVDNPKSIYAITTEKEFYVGKRFLLFRSKSKISITSLNRARLESEPCQSIELRF